MAVHLHMSPYSLVLVHDVQRTNSSESDPSCHGLQLPAQFPKGLHISPGWIEITDYCSLFCSDGLPHMRLMKVLTSVADKGKPVPPPASLRTSSYQQSPGDAGELLEQQDGSAVPHPSPSQPRR